MIDRTISHYKILAEVGRGGMGVVYKAEDTRLHRTVALKCITPSVIASEEEKHRFVHEAQAAATLLHPNVAAIFDFEEIEERSFIVMEYVEGRSLKEKIGSGPLKLIEALDFAIQVAAGLQAAHEKGIVHRDIKSANIMVTEKGQAKIMDFGLAKLRGQSVVTKEGTTMGTVAYMSPEQARGEKLDHCTDIWSLGVVFYEMITGQLPFPGEYDQAILYSIINEDPEPPTALRSGIPMELERIVLKMLAKDRAARYRHVDEVANDIRQVREAIATGARPKTRPEQRRRHRLGFLTFIWTIGIVLFGLLAGVLLFYPYESIPFSERDWILITDFQNLTREEVFDRSLNTALTVSIEQSRYVNVFPRRRVEEALKRMKKSPEERVDEAVGREVAERENVHMLLVPSIGAVGGRYILTAILEDPASGKYLKTQKVYADGKAKVLGALDDLTKKIRKDLGESRSAIGEKSKPLAKVTTSSLEALRQYSLGEGNQRRGHFDQAKIYYERAVEIDSSFTIALAALGMLEYEYYDRDLGKRHLSLAAEHINDLTDRERMGIQAAHAIAVEGDLEKAAAIYKGYVAEYPDKAPPHNNLGRVYYMLGRYRDSVREYRAAIRLEPTLLIAYNGLITNYLYHLGEIDSALVWSKKEVAFRPENEWVYDHLGWAYLGLDSLAKAREAFEHALKINPQFALDLYRLAHIARLHGDYPAAVQYLQRIFKADPEDAWVYYQLGIIYNLMGNRKQARIHFERFRRHAAQWLRSNSSDAGNYFSLALANARLGQAARARSLGKKGLAIDSTRHFEYAQVLSVLGRKEEALDELEKAVQGGFSNYIWMKIHPDFQVLYAVPPFQTLVKKSIK